MAHYVSKITDWPEDERPRERLVNWGPEKLLDAELLAIILRTGSQDATAIDLANVLLKRFGKFRGLDRKSIPEICEVSGIGEAKAVMIKAALEIGKRLLLEKEKANQKISSSEDIYEKVKLYVRDSDREIFKIILLTSRNQIVFEKILFEGSLSESLVVPREIVKECVNRSAASIIFVHNHPSGDPTPSLEDKNITKRLKLVCELVGVRVLDHVIIGKDSYYSFADSGIL